MLLLKLFITNKLIEPSAMPARQSVLLIIPMILMVAVIAPTYGLAQRLDGTLRVQVSDKTGGSVPGAMVTATNEQTKVVTSATSNGEVYVFPNLLTGSYTVTVDARGFNRFVRDHVTVIANQVTDAQAPLEVGSQSTTVSVTAEGETDVKTTSSDLSAGFTGPIVHDLPPSNAIGGDIKELAILLPNTTTQPGGVAGSGGSVGGLRPRFNSFTIDSADDNSVQVNGSVTPVIQDAVSDFTVLTDQFSAEYGHSAAAIFAITTKSGTDDFHGEAHEYNRNRNYDAYDSHLDGARGVKTPFDYNRVGASIGGPIVKDRLFFFGAVEFQDENLSAASPSITTPTAAGLASLKTVAHDPAVLAILNQFPSAPVANETPQTVDGVSIPMGNFIALAPDFVRQHDFQINMDWNRGRHSIRGRYLYDRQRSPSINVSEPLPQFNGTNNIDNRKVVLSDVWTQSSTLVNELRFAFTHAVGPGFTVPAAFANFPNVEIDGLGVNIGPNGSAPQVTSDNTYQWLDNVTKLIGRHTAKFGVEVRNNISPSNFLAFSRGAWDYGSTVGGPTALEEFINDQVPTGANGALRGAGIGSFAGNFKSFYTFAQDDWKVTSRLTLNLGLRYEYNGVPRDAALQTLNAISNDPRFGLIFSKQKPDTNDWAPRVGFAFDPTGSGKWSIRGGFGVFYDVTAIIFDLSSLPPQLQTTQNPTLTCALAGAPAWCPPAGSGIAATNNAANPNIHNGFLQSGGLLQVNVPPATQAAARAATLGIMNDAVTEPKVLGWTLNVQHQIFSNTTVELRYVGNHAVSLPAQVRLNSASAFDPNVPGGGIPPLPTYLSPAAIPSAVPAPASTLATFNAFNIEPFSVDGFLSPVTAYLPVANSIYHAGSVDVKHRLGHGLFIDGNYTLAKTLDDATNEFFTSRVDPRRAQDGYNITSDWGRSALDIRNKFAMSIVYDLPTAKANNGIVRGFANGWELIATYLAQSGQPITALSDIDSNDNGDAAADRVILNPNGVPRTGSVVVPVCNDGPGGATRIAGGGTGTCPAAHVVGYVAVNGNAQYIQAGVGALANLARNTISTPGLNIWNISAAKVTRISERVSAEFRIETYDTFNHPNPSIGLASNSGALDAATNGNPFSTYAFIDSGNKFLNSSYLDGGRRTMQLGAKLIF
jgi:hypothetical protein